MKQKSEVCSPYLNRDSLEKILKYWIKEARKYKMCTFDYFIKCMEDDKKTKNTYSKT
jgi:hypothetical protein